MKILAITQARYGSSRFPGKILKKIGDNTLLDIHLERILQSKTVSKLKVATTTEPEADKIVAVCNAHGVEAFKGSIDDVLERFYLTAKSEQPDYVVRLTSDCPLIDPMEIDLVVSALIAADVDYASNVLEPTRPDGVDVEAFKFSALEKAYNEATLKSDREHVTPYIWRNSSVKGGNIFKSVSVKGTEDYSSYRMTVDENEDFELISQLIEKLDVDKNWIDYINYLESHPDLISVNNKYTRNEGYAKSLKNN